MHIVIDPSLQAYIDPLTPEELAALERSILAEGCRDALVLWGEVLVDGHNRYRICQQHGLPFQTVQNPRIQSLEDVHLWMIDQHLGRRSVSNFQRGLLALRKSEILGEQVARARAAPEPGAAPEGQAAGAATGQTTPPAQRLDSREAIARAARLSSGQVGMIEKIQKQATPELVAAVRAGTISINAAAAVASLPAAEQVAAAAAGADELRQAARRVRDGRRRPAAAPADPADPTAAAEPPPFAVSPTAPASALSPASSVAPASARAATTGDPDGDPARDLQHALAALRAENAALAAENRALRARLAALGDAVA